MAKDPRFNFYTDNWIGGTEGFTLEQEGAYLSLIIMQSKIGRFTEQQAIDKFMQKTRGDAAACAGLWFFLMHKFETDGNLFWSPRLEKEIQKSQTHSKRQSERAKSRWNKNGIDSGTAAAYAPEMPVNRSGSGTIITTNTKTITSDWLEWGKLIVAGNDQYWDAMHGQRVTEAEMDVFLSVATRNRWKIETQQEFRISLKGFNANGINGKTTKTNYKVQ